MINAPFEGAINKHIYSRLTEQNKFSVLEMPAYFILNINKKHVSQAFFFKFKVNKSVEEM